MKETGSKKTKKMSFPGEDWERLAPPKKGKENATVGEIDKPQSLERIHFPQKPN